MNFDMDKIEMVRKKAGVTYAEARDLLSRTDGDVLEAIILAEQEQDRWTEEFVVKGNEIVEKVKDLLHQGNITRVRIKNGPKVILEFPVTLGVAGALWAPQLAAIGAIVTLLSECTIEVERSE